MVDEVIAVLQGQLRNNQSANQGAEHGMRLVRAAFAVMLKLNSELSQCFEELLDAIELRDGDDIPPEVGDERNEAMK
jgi:hypothetical protein